MITWNSPKNRNSLSGEFGVLSYDFLPYTYFSVTHGIMLGRCFEVEIPRSEFRVQCALLALS